MKKITSLPAWGAWIEITRFKTDLDPLGRSPHGERGLKLARLCRHHMDTGRSPHGERGLKYL